MSPAKKPANDTTTVYFDGACPLCIAEIDHYRARTQCSDVAYVDVSATDADLPQGLDAQTALARFHVQSAQGELKSGAAGFAELWRQVPGWRWLGAAARIPGVTPALELVYRAFLKLRPLMVRVFVWMKAQKQRAP